MIHETEGKNYSQHTKKSVLGFFCSFTQQLTMHSRDSSAVGRGSETQDGCGRKSALEETLRTELERVKEIRGEISCRIEGGKKHQIWKNIGGRASGFSIVEEEESRKWKCQQWK
jgi:hypothetical protein